MENRIGMNGLTPAQLAGIGVYVWKMDATRTKYELYVDETNRQLVLECLEECIRKNTLMILENEKDRNEGMYGSTLKLVQFREMLEHYEDIVIEGLSWSIEAYLIEMLVDRIDGRM